MYLILKIFGLAALLAVSFALSDSGRSWKGLIGPITVMIFGILVPLAVFFLSLFLIPMTLGDVRYGWVDCWHLGKLALTPMVVFASVCLYVFEGRLVKENNRVVSVGMLTGALIANVCLLYGVAMLGGALGLFDLFLIVPAYIALWYFIRVCEMIRASRIGWMEFLWTAIVSLPCWIASILWSIKIYKNTPATAGCFVATAASHGHEDFVGPFVEVKHHGRLRRANQQLITLWQFEAFWRARAPRSHSIFRRAYNWLGPRIASQIKSPWLADLTWLALKPVECFAGFVVNNQTKQGVSHEPCKMDQLFQSKPSRPA